jgi:rhamnosyl/mannosyltransferase
MNWLAEHPEAREAYGAAAYRRIKEHFSQSNMLKELRTLYEKLIGEEA